MTSNLPRAGRVWLLVVTCALLVASVAVAVAAEPFLAMGPPDAGPASWMARSGERLVFGSGREVVSAGATPSRFLVDGNVSGGALLGDQLFLVLDGVRLVSVDLLEAAASVQPMTALPLSPGNLLHVAGMGNLLLVGEDHQGVHLVKFRRMHPMPEHAGHGAAGPAYLGLFPLSGRITAIAASGGMLWVATATSGELLQVDLHNPSRPVLQQQLFLDAPVVALDSDGTRLHVLTEGGLQVLAHGGDGAWAVRQRHPGIHGAALISNGRSLMVASADGAVQGYREAAPEATLFTVNVLDDFFTPDTLTVYVGDSVRWQNSAGIHNTSSCVVGESGCTAESNELFFSGIPQPGLWTYDYTFTDPGENPYVCQAHAPFMTGEITVLPAPTTPPPVPDGTFGAPMSVESSGPSEFTLHWDAATCTPQDQHQVLYGLGSGLPGSPGGTFGLQGSRCLLGAGGPYVWTDAPDPSADASGLLWFLLVAYGGSGEGSWGQGSDGLERNSPFPGGVSGLCGNFTKDLANSCP